MEMRQQLTGYPVADTLFLANAATMRLPLFHGLQYDLDDFRQGLRGQQAIAINGPDRADHFSDINIHQSNPLTSPATSLMIPTPGTWYSPS